MKSEIRVSREFVEAFDSVAAHYNLKELGQYDEAKQSARADLESAIVCFASLAGEVRYQPDDYTRVERDEFMQGEML